MFRGWTNGLVSICAPSFTVAVFAIIPISTYSSPSLAHVVKRPLQYFWQLRRRQKVVCH